MAAMLRRCAATAATAAAVVLLLAAGTTSTCAASADATWTTDGIEFVDRLESAAPIATRSSSSVAVATSLVELVSLAGPLAVAESCPLDARYQIGLCKKLTKTIRQSEGGNVHAVPGLGDEVCQIARFAYEDMRTCSKVYDHIADVGQSWDLTQLLRTTKPEQFCISVLAEPSHSRAILSPRTERKCLGTATAEDKKFDAEPAAPNGYTGNILEDPFDTNVYYLDGCKCTCRSGNRNVKKDCAGCSGKAAKPEIVVPKKPSKPVPVKPLSAPSLCVKKTNFPYRFPYSSYLQKEDALHLVADFELQRMRLYQKEVMVKEYKMSSSEVGVGHELGSLMSPSGKLRIRELIGANATLGTNFVDLKPTNKSSGPDEKAAIQTRVLVLEGEDHANANTAQRAIVISGTNKVASLGHPASQGSFRLSNEDVVDLFDRVKVGTQFFAIPSCAWPRGEPKTAGEEAGAKPKDETKPKDEKLKDEKPKDEKPKDEAKPKDDVKPKEETKPKEESKPAAKEETKPSTSSPPAPAPSASTPSAPARFQQVDAEVEAEDETEAEEDSEEDAEQEDEMSHQQHISYLEVEMVTPEYID